MADRIQETAEDRRPGIADMEAALAAADPNDVGDDFGNDGNGVEPAMAVLPAASLQGMPGSASPGLPPVDPVEASGAPERLVEASFEIEAGQSPRRILGDDTGSDNRVRLCRALGRWHAMTIATRIGPAPNI